MTLSVSYRAVLSACRPFAFESGIGPHAQDQIQHRMSIRSLPLFSLQTRRLCETRLSQRSTVELMSN